MITFICLLVWLVVGFGFAFFVGAFIRAYQGDREE
ncbi:hypothetical protein [Alteromonas phage P24]|nr:hypothetical protein [Alteromonas phage P24]